MIFPNRWTVSAAVAAIVAGVGMVWPSALAVAQTQNLGPGVRVVVHSANAKLKEQCTAGFVAFNAKRAPMLFTAGHCNVGTKVMMKSMTTGADVQVGEMVVSRFEGSSGDDADIAVMRPLGTTSLVSTVDGTAVSGVLRPREGTLVCMMGATSGRSCGPVLQSTDTKIKFRGEVSNGDSGGPVWAYGDRGEALAVGIVIRQSDEGYPVVELLAPWMREFDLSIA